MILGLGAALLFRCINQPCIFKASCFISASNALDAFGASVSQHNNLGISGNFGNLGVEPSMVGNNTFLLQKVLQQLQTLATALKRSYNAWRHCQSVVIYCQCQRMSKDKSLVSKFDVSRVGHWDSMRVMSLFVPHLLQFPTSGGRCTRWTRFNFRGLKALSMENSCIIHANFIVIYTVF